jgi:hypothetical protein
VRDSEASGRITKYPGSFFGLAKLPVMGRRVAWVGRLVLNSNPGTSSDSRREFCVGFQTPPDRRALMTVTTDGYDRTATSNGTRLLGTRFYTDSESQVPTRTEGLRQRWSKRENNRIPDKYGKPRYSGTSEMTPETAVYKYASLIYFWIPTLYSCHGPRSKRRWPPLPP